MCLTLADPESSTQNLNYGWKWIWGFQLDAANTSADLTTLKPGAPDYVDGENCISMGNGLVYEDRVFSFHPWLQPVVMNGKLACLLQLSFRIYSVCVCVLRVHICQDACVEVIGQSEGISSVLLPSGTQGWKSCGQAWWQEPLPPVSFWWHTGNIFASLLAAQDSFSKILLGTIVGKKL